MVISCPTLGATFCRGMGKETDILVVTANLSKEYYFKLGTLEIFSDEESVAPMLEETAQIGRDGR